jgi:hypothetical protein
MKSIVKSALALTASLFVITPSSEAAISMTIQAGRLDLANGSNAIAEGTLIQLINLGGDGIFNEINIFDANNTGNAHWVSGDDTLVSALFFNPPDSFTSGVAFDLRAGSDAGANGELIRTLGFDDNTFTVGTKFGIRWFPGVAATDFATTTLVLGQAFGQYTNQSPADPFGEPWMIVQDRTATTNYQFHTLGTVEIGGSDPATAGDASQTVVPEPAAIGMSLLGAAGLTLLRRRRA